MCLTLHLSAGSSWLGNLGAGEEGDSAMWENDMVFSVGGSPSLNQSRPVVSVVTERGRERGKKREQSFSVSAILWAQCKYTSLSTGALERRGVGCSFWSSAICLSGVQRWLCLLAAFAGSLCMGSLAAALFTFGASTEMVKHSWGTLCFLKGWG